jgi:hypothetical protein
MNECEKSGPAIGAMTPANKDGATIGGAGGVKGGAEGNAERHSTLRAQDRARVAQGLDRIR